ncbi:MULTISPECIES: helix-turn-helix domain-containing protein [Xenorhabdus]|uniref:Similarities with transcriptional regulator n=2 Tax=Xenorhabdus TaxID=626 RepID=W1IXZ2_9GAMM|nr:MULTISPECIES: helix-turn-helix transcriptional regulator [Xenorhabdus]MDC9583433.1 helix-turn-helix transcriptional regulator [Xenorhabdus sp. PR6a]CDL83357.1 Similarities with transcriptional regulator [Xenorhabdus cabanillasii JM26]CEE91624.1 Similarities with transcriptional regulator [Xenorhabdus nematophila str. Anatoliense]
MTISFQDWLSENGMEIFATRLREAREARKMTQARLADLLAVNRRVYNRWERGSSVPQLDTVVKIAQALQMSIDALVGLEEPKAPKIHNPKLQALYEQIDSLSDEDQQALIVLMDSLVTRTKMAKLIVGQQ